MSWAAAAAASEERARARAQRVPKGKEEETLRAPNETFLAGGRSAPLSVDITDTG